MADSEDRPPNRCQDNDEPTQQEHASKDTTHWQWLRFVNPDTKAAEDQCNDELHGAISLERFTTMTPLSGSCATVAISPETT